MKKDKLIEFGNSHDSISDVKIFLGDYDGIQRYDRFKYPITEKLVRAMQGATWFPREVNFGKDRTSFYETLSPEFQEIYKANLLFQTMADSLANRFLDNILSGITTSPEWESVFKWQAHQELVHCLVDGTECLTDSGFKDFNDVTIEDKVATFDKNGKIVFDYPSDVIHSHYKGNILTFEHSTFHQSVTPNHRMVGIRPKYFNKGITEGQLEIKFAEDFNAGGYNLPISGKVDNGTDITSLERLAIAYQADGSLVNNQENSTKNGYCYRFHLKKKRKIDRLIKLINEAGLKFTIKDEPDTSKKAGFTNIRLWSPMKFDKEFSWITLDKCSLEFCNGFFDELKQWDGCIRKNNAIAYSNTNMQAVDVVIALASISGRQTGNDFVDIDTTNRVLSKNKKDFSTLHIVDKLYKSGRTISKTESEYDGLIHCVTVPSGMFIIRSNGHVSVTGNSEAYSWNIREVFHDPEKFFNEGFTNPEIQKRLEIENTKYWKLLEKPNDKVTILTALVHQYCLESIRFFVSFLYTFMINELNSQTLQGSENNIILIANDEKLHVAIFKHLIGILKNEKDEGFSSLISTIDFDKFVINIFKKVIDSELEWFRYLSGIQEIQGFTEKTIREFLEYYSHNSCKNIGVETSFNSTENELVSFFKGKTDIRNQRALAQETDQLSYNIGVLTDGIDKMTSTTSIEELLK